MIIDLELKKFIGPKKQIKCDGLFITRNNKNYFVTLHGFLPIESCKNKDFNILFQSNWNELLILENKNITNKFNVKFSIKLPKVDSEISNKYNKATVTEICFINFAFLPNYPKTVYIKIKIDKINSNFSNGIVSNDIVSHNILPGTPFYNKNSKLVGIVSLIEDEYAYLLPSYYIEKTFSKNNRFEMFDTSSTILRINKNIVRDNMIYNPYIGCRMPILTFIVLESNRKLEIETTESIYKVPKYVEFKDKLLIVNKRKIIKHNNYFNINCGTLHYLKLINNDIVINIMSNLENYKDVNSLKLYDNYRIGN